MAAIERMAANFLGMGFAGVRVQGNDQLLTIG